MYTNEPRGRSQSADCTYVTLCVLVHAWLDHSLDLVLKQGVYNNEWRVQAEWHLVLTKCTVLTVLFDLRSPSSSVLSWNKISKCVIGQFVHQFDIEPVVMPLTDSKDYSGSSSLSDSDSNRDHSEIRLYVHGPGAACIVMHDCFHCPAHCRVCTGWGFLRWSLQREVWWFYKLTFDPECINMRCKAISTRHFDNHIT